MVFFDVDIDISFDLFFDIFFDILFDIFFYYFQVDVNKQVTCHKCRGSGAEKESDVKTCTACGGQGVRVVRHQIAPGFIQQMQTTCDVCSGKGKVVKSTCPLCKGKKIVRGSNELSVNIEPGVPDGHAIVFENEGDQHPDITSGDIVFIVRMEEHPVFRREGDNLYRKY